MRLEGHRQSTNIEDRRIDDPIAQLIFDLMTQETPNQMRARPPGGLNPSEDEILRSILRDPATWGTTVTPFDENDPRLGE